MAPPPALNALLGLDGGVRFLARAGGADVASIGGSPYSGWPARPGGATHCVFDGKAFTVVLRVPEGTTGVVEAFAYDYEAYRVEEIALEGGTPQPVEGFGGGKWLLFPFAATQSADGELRLTVRNVSGGNCVLSRVRLKFDGER